MIWLDGRAEGTWFSKQLGRESIRRRQWGFYSMQSRQILKFGALNWYLYCIWIILTTLKRAMKDYTFNSKMFLNEPAALIISIISVITHWKQIYNVHSLSVGWTVFFMEAVEMSPNAALECGQTVNTQNYRAKVFLYLCPLNFSTLAVFSRGQIATPRFVLSLPLLQHPVTHQLTSNPSMGRLMKKPPLHRFLPCSMSPPEPFKISPPR